MPSTSSVSIPQGAATVAHRYHRFERALASILALLVATLVAMVMVSRSVVIGVLVGAVIIVLLRIPLFNSAGIARLVTDADADSVRADFRSVTPPVLAFQWGIADRVRQTETGAVYDISYLFGLRTARVETAITQPRASNDTPTAELTLTVSVNEHSWGTYYIAIQEDGPHALVELEWTSNRRFGLQRLPQWVLARHYRPTALAAQDYRVDEYESVLSL